ncbi:MAG: FAD-dependent oxidoreductase [Planctomycetaceae bacterium]|nr:FAD-dependent oxidoreductase [Planctomycetaceae bacterium]HCK41208.1 FAD-dependent oxidoreductase [Planctomycetaceae bacterium]
MRIAIIGTGISGSLVARLLSTQHDVTVYEANSYPGGHANTVDVTISGKHYEVDTAFMVFNRQTYPNFCRLLELLQVPSQPSNMSFSVRCPRSGLEYQGSNLNGLFARRSNLLRPTFLKMLRDIVKFNRRGSVAAVSGELKDGRTVGEFLQQCRVGQPFVQNYLMPMAAAIWSTRPTAILDFPADFMIGFFANHGLLQMSGRPEWRTIRGGSRSYVEALLDPIWDDIHLARPVASVSRSSDKVMVRPVDGLPERFDQVVFATHADQTLDMLSDPTPTEFQILSAFPYQPNEAVLHTDIRLLPKRPNARASWNYHIPSGQADCASVTYDLSRLQGHKTPGPLLLTLNESSAIDPEKILRTFTYQHPAFSCESIAAQQRAGEISGHFKTHYCGAYWGYGFHEDGVNSALAVARNFGIELEACTAVSTKELSSITAASR